jgi:hypothetical protein
MFIVLSVVVALLAFLLHRRYELYDEYQVATVPIQDTPIDPPETLGALRPTITAEPITLTRRTPEENSAVDLTMQVPSQRPNVVAPARSAPTATREGNVVRLGKHR